MVYFVGNVSEDDSERDVEITHPVDDEALGQLVRRLLIAWVDECDNGVPLSNSKLIQWMTAAATDIREGGCCGIVEVNERQRQIFDEGKSNV